MTWLLALSALVGVALVTGGVWWATSARKVGHGEPDIGPADLPYWAGDRKP